MHPVTPSLLIISQQPQCCAGIGSVLTWGLANPEWEGVAAPPLQLYTCTHIVQYNMYIWFNLSPLPCLLQAGKRSLVTEVFATLTSTSKHRAMLPAMACPYPSTHPLHPDPQPPPFTPHPYKPTQARGAGSSLVCHTDKHQQAQSHAAGHGCFRCGSAAQGGPEAGPASSVQCHKGP